MTYSRRRFLANGVSLAIFVASYETGVADNRSCDGGVRPDTAKFESGDLLWPKRRDVYVPYASGGARDRDAERRQWEAERDAFVASVRSRPDADEHERRAATALKRMTFEEFHTRYTTGGEPGRPVQYGSGVRVGHVAIVERDPSGDIYVIEAMPDPGVNRLLYRDWLASRRCELVWHGRLHGVSRELRANIAVEAKRQLSKPYNFWSLKLDDDAGFYCSKLVWLSALRATKIAVDGDANPLRLFWLSPKQLLYAPKMVRLHNPDNYGGTR
jgi:hypothetical protein